MLLAAVHAVIFSSFFIILSSLYCSASKKQVYTLFHRFLHHRSVYGLVHKHHHKQKAPSRGNLDAINVHPFEFVCGEYLHLACVYLIPCHAYAAGLFMALAGVFASLNHTRFDVNFLSAAVYTVKVITGVEEGE